MNVPNLAPGTVVAGKFTIRSLLGYGGASASFRAVSSQGREVVVKLFSAALGQRRDAMDQLQRYVAETNALPQEFVVIILEAGYDPGTGTPFTVTDFIATPSLAQFIMRRPMSTDEVATMLRSIAAVVDAGHVRELFHHALKPTNIFVESESPGQLKIMDFGVSLARTFFPSQEGFVVSAPWMAPEQVQAGAPPGAAADIFSAALVAFFSLTGNSYWRSCQGVPNLGAWQQEVMSPRMPASQRAAELRMPLNPALDPVFERALAIDPRERYRTLGEFAAAFMGFPAGRGDQATLAFPTPAYEPPAAPHASPYAPMSPQGPPMPPQGPADGGYPPLPGDPARAEATATRAPPLNYIAPPTIATMGVPSRPGSSKALPIVVGIASALLVSGAVAAWFLIGRTTDSGTGPAASASSAQPIASADTPATTGTEAPAPSTSTEAATPDAGADAEAATSSGVKVTLTCSPEPCEKISIDGKPLDDLNAPLELSPGKHKVDAERSGYLTHTEWITVVAGKELEREFKLRPKSTPGTVRPITPVKKDCSKLKLLERQKCEKGQ